MYKLTEKGIKACKNFISECKTKRKEILDTNTDTVFETDIPTVEDVEHDVNMFVEVGVYCNYWGITDNYDSDYPITLTIGTDFIEVPDNIEVSDNEESEETIYVL